MAKKAKCPKCASVIEFADAKPESCPSCGVKFRSAPKPGSPTPPITQVERPAPSPLDLPSPLDSPLPLDLPSSDLGAPLTDWDPLSANAAPLDLDPISASASPLDLDAPSPLGLPLDLDPLSSPPTPAAAPVSSAPARPAAAPVAAVSVEAPRPGIAQFGTLGASLLLMVTTLLLVLVFPSPRPNAVLLGDGPQDLTTFPDLAAILRPNATELGSQAFSDLQSKPEAELLEVLRQIAAGESKINPDLQKALVEWAAQDKRPALAAAAVSGISRFDSKSMTSALTRAMFHADPDVSSAAVSAAVKFNDAASVACVFDAWETALSTRQDTAKFSAAVPQFSPKLVHPQVMRHFVKNPEILSYVRDHGDTMTLSDLLQLLPSRQGIGIHPIRSTPPPTEPPANPQEVTPQVLERVIVANWKQNSSRFAQEGIRIEGNNVLLGSDPPIPLFQFARLEAIDELRDTVTKALFDWPKTWKAPDVRSNPQTFTYYTLLETWTGQDQEKLVTADISSEDEFRRQLGLSEIQTGRTPNGVNTLFELWAKSSNRRALDEVIDRLQPPQQGVVLEQLASSNPELRDCALKFLTTHAISPERFERLYAIATESGPAMIAARVAFLTNREKFPSGEFLGPEQDALVELLGLENPFETAIFPAIPSWLRGASAPRTEELIRKTSPYLLSNAKLGLVGLDTVVWEYLLALDASNILRIVETELAVADARRHDELVAAIVLSGDPRACQLLIRGLLDEKLRRVYSTALVQAGSAAEPGLIKALASPSATEPVVVEICAILQRTGTEASKEALEAVAQGDSAAKPNAMKALEGIRLRRAGQQQPARFTQKTEREGQRSSLPSQLGGMRPADAPSTASAAAMLSVDEALERLSGTEIRARLLGARALAYCEVDASRRKQIAAATLAAIDPANVPLAWYAIRAHAHWAGDAAVPQLVTLVTGQDPYLAVAAADALAAIPNDDSAQALAELLLSPRQKLLGRMALIRLGRDNPELVAKQVVTLVDHDDLRVRLEAVVVVSRLGLPNGLELLQGALQRHPEFGPYQSTLTFNHKNAENARRERKRS